MPLPSIADVAAKAIETPKDCTETDVMRLGLWFLDHPEHVRRHAELAASMGRAMLPSRRLAGVQDLLARQESFASGLEAASPADGTASPEMQAAETA